MKLMVVLEEASACPCSLQCLRKLDVQTTDQVTMVTVAKPARRRREEEIGAPKGDWPSQSPVPKPATLEYLDEALARVRAEAQDEVQKASARQPQTGITSRVVSHRGSDAAIAAMYDERRPNVTILCSQMRPLRGSRWRQLSARIRKAGGLVIECGPAE